jgi:hypothetical protein
MRQTCIGLILALAASGCASDPNWHPRYRNSIDIPINGVVEPTIKTPADKRAERRTIIRGVAGIAAAPFTLVACLVSERARNYVFRYSL